MKKIVLAGFTSFALAFLSLIAFMIIASFGICQFGGFRAIGTSLLLLTFISFTLGSCIFGYLFYFDKKTFKKTFYSKESFESLYIIFILYPIFIITIVPLLVTQVRGLENLSPLLIFISLLLLLFPFIYYVLVFRNRQIKKSKS